MSNKKKIFTTILAGGVILLLGVYAIVLINIQKKEKDLIRVPKAIEREGAIVISSYRGYFISRDRDYIKVKIAADGSIGGFRIDKDTKVIHYIKSLSGENSEEEYSIDKIPKDAQVSIDVIGEGTNDSPQVVHKIIY